PLLPLLARRPSRPDPPPPHRPRGKRRPISPAGVDLERSGARARGILLIPTVFGCPVVLEGIRTDWAGEVGVDSPAGTHSICTVGGIPRRCKLRCGDLCVSGGWRASGLREDWRHSLARETRDHLYDGHVLSDRAAALHFAVVGAGGDARRNRVCLSRDRSRDFEMDARGPEEPSHGNSGDRLYPGSTPNFCCLGPWQVSASLVRLCPDRPGDVRFMPVASPHDITERRTCPTEGRRARTLTLDPRVRRICDHVERPGSLLPRPARLGILRA